LRPEGLAASRSHGRAQRLEELDAVELTQRITSAKSSLPCILSGEACRPEELAAMKSSRGNDQWLVVGDWVALKRAELVAQYLAAIMDLYSVIVAPR
jgi:hypothetical protein